MIPKGGLVNRVAASESFAKSPRLREHLTYPAECALRDPQSPVFSTPPGGVCKRLTSEKTGRFRRVTSYVLHPNPNYTNHICIKAKNVK